MIYLLFNLMCMNVYPACICVHYMCAWCPLRSGDGTGFHGTMVIGDFGQPCWFCKSSEYS